MNKIFKMKKWLTLEEAARRLSSSAEESISEADVLRLALDGELILSVDFVNHARGKPWVRVPLEDAKTFTYDPAFFGNEGAPKEVITGVSLNENEVLQPLETDTPTTLRGVFDLTMWGAEALDVEQMYQELTDGPPVELMNIEGTFVKGQQGMFFQLLESFEDNGYSPGSKAQLAHIETRILTEEIAPEQAEKMRAFHKERRIEFLDKASKNKPIDNYYPASGLPDTCRLVVRNESIRLLEDKLLAEPSASLDELSQRSKPSHFLAISALLDLLKEPVKHPRPNGLKQAAIIESILERFESRGLSKRTLEDIFSAANKTMKTPD
jgi:hypothetical protein